MNKVQLRFLKEANSSEAQKLLTAWEKDFIDSLGKKSVSYELTEKQNNVLNEIHNKVFNVANPAPAKAPRRHEKTRNEN